MDLIRTCSEVWGYVERVDAALRRLAPRTREHLHRRGLLACPCHPEGGLRASNSYAEVARRKKAAREKRATKKRTVARPAK